MFSGSKFQIVILRGVKRTGLRRFLKTKSDSLVIRFPFFEFLHQLVKSEDVDDPLAQVFFTCAITTVQFATELKPVGM